LSLEDVQIDYAEKGTVEAVLKTLDEKDESTVLFGLDLVDNLDPNDIVARLPRGLLHHSSSAVRARAVKLFAARPDAITLNEIRQMLQDKSNDVRAQAISAACAIFKRDAIAIVRPFLENSDSQVKTRAMECLLRHGDAATRETALNSIRSIVDDKSAGGEPNRLEVCRLMGEIYDPEFFFHLGRLIREDASDPVIRAAMAAAGRGKYPGVVGDIISRLGSNTTKAAARDALIEYGEIAVKELRTALFDSRVSRKIRLSIPRTLSKINSQSAMNALLGGLLEEDHSIRFEVILALEEMSRRFADLKVDREIIESAIMSDALLYYRRFVMFIALFGRQEESLGHGPSVLSFALTDSMERVKERMMWLLSLIYPRYDIRRFWAGLNSGEPNKQADAIEFLDNLLSGEIKEYVFPIFSDAPQAQRFKAALSFLDVTTMDTQSALYALLEQDDIWLRAATVWEIGIRRLTGFRDQIAEFLDSDNVILRETANKVMHGVWAL
jgi:AAA family ATP:ADP antiporter